MRRPTRNKIIAGGLVTAMFVGIGSATASACGLTDLFGFGRGFASWGGGLWGGHSTSTISMSQQQVLSAKLSVVQQVFGSRYKVSSMADLSSLICRLPEARRDAIGMMLGVGKIHVTAGGSTGWHATTATGGSLAIALENTHVNTLISIATMLTNSQVSVGGGMALGGMQAIITGALGAQFSTWTQVATHLQSQSDYCWSRMRTYLGTSVNRYSSSATIAAKLQTLTAQQLMNLMWTINMHGSKSTTTRPVPPTPVFRPSKGNGWIVGMPDSADFKGGTYIQDVNGNWVLNGKGVFYESGKPAPNTVIDTGLSQQLNMMLSMNGQSFSVSSHRDLAQKVLASGRHTQVLAALGIHTFASINVDSLTAILAQQSSEKLMTVARITSGMFTVQGTTTTTTGTPVVMGGGSSSTTTGGGVVYLPQINYGDRLPTSHAEALSGVLGVSVSSISTYEQLAVMMAQLPPSKLMSVQQVLGLDVFGNASFGLSGMSLTGALVSKLKMCGLSTLLQVGRLITGGFGFGGTLSGSLGIGVGVGGSASSQWGSWSQTRRKQYAIPFCQGTGAVRDWYRDYGDDWGDFDGFISRNEGVINGLSRGTINASMAAPFLLQGLGSFSGRAGWNEAYSATSNHLVTGCS